MRPDREALGSKPPKESPTEPRARAPVSCAKSPKAPQSNPPTKDEGETKEEGKRRRPPPPESRRRRVLLFVGKGTRVVAMLVLQRGALGGGAVEKHLQALWTVRRALSGLAHVATSGLDEVYETTPRPELRSTLAEPSLAS